MVPYSYSLAFLLQRRRHVDAGIGIAVRTGGTLGTWPPTFYNLSIEISFLPHKSILLSLMAPQIQMPFYTLMLICIIMYNY